MSSIREMAAHHGHAHEPGFRWRGREVSRLEGLSDAVFAFAITLLVISLEVPKSMHEMVAAMRGFIGFIFSFFLIYRLWLTQYRFFRRYGLEDSRTINLNGLLLFMVMFFVYPLKFLTSGISEWLMEHTIHDLHPGLMKQVLDNNDGRALALFYFWGLAAVMGTLALMYRHAYTRRHALELTPFEVHRTQHAYRRLAIGAFFGIISPLSILGTYTAYAEAADRIELALVAILVVAVVRMRRAAKGAPSADAAYVAPDRVPEPLG